MATTRRQFIQAAAAFAVTAGIARPALRRRRPNILFILADDLGYGVLGCYGQKNIQTPFLDQLAQEGTRLTHFCSGSAACAPSRCSLLPGLHTGHCRHKGNDDVHAIFEKLDGLSLRPTLSGQANAQCQHNYLHWQYRRGEIWQHAIREDNWKALDLGSPEAWELYDLSSDIGEWHNVAGSFPGQIQQMLKSVPQA